MIRELLTADVESIEGIGAVGAVFEQVFFGLGELFAGFVFTEAVATVGDTGRLNSENKVFVVRAVEKRHQALLPGEALIDEKVLFIVAHRVTEVNRLHAPAVLFKFVDNDPVKVLLVDGIVRAEGRGIVIKHDGFILMRGVVAAEISD